MAFVWSWLAGGGAGTLLAVTGGPLNPMVERDLKVLRRQELMLGQGTPVRDAHVRAVVVVAKRKVLRQPPVKR